MSENNWNPFEGEPTGGEGKTRFGLLALIANKVELVGGASYTVPGLTLKGEPFAFKGKQLTPDGKNTHVILTLEQHDSKGEKYMAFQDFMYWKNDAGCKITLPTLKARFGEKLTGLYGKRVPVQIEEIEYQDRDYTRRAWKVVNVFVTPEDCVRAEAAFFKRENGNSASSPVSQPSAVGASSGASPLALFATSLATNIAKWRAEGNDDAALVPLIAVNYDVTPKVAQEYVASLAK